MTIVYTGDFVSGSHSDAGSFNVIAIDAPELMRDDSTDASTGDTGDEHKVVAGGRFKTGEAKITVPYDEGLLDKQPGGQGVGSNLILTAVGMSVTFDLMVLKGVSPGQLKIKGGQPTIVLTFTKSNVVAAGV